MVSEVLFNEKPEYCLNSSQNQNYIWPLEGRFHDLSMKPHLLNSGGFFALGV